MFGVIFKSLFEGDQPVGRLFESSCLEELFSQHRMQVLGMDGGDLVVTVGFGQEAYVGSSAGSIASIDAGICVSVLRCLLVLTCSIYVLLCAVGVAGAILRWLTVLHVCSPCDFCKVHCFVLHELGKSPLQVYIYVIRCFRMMLEASSCQRLCCTLRTCPISGRNFVSSCGLALMDFLHSKSFTREVHSAGAGQCVARPLYHR